jgi:hypothetical protein
MRAKKGTRNMNNPDQLHHDVNDVYTAYDEGDIEKGVAIEKLKLACEHFLKVKSYEIDYGEGIKPERFHATTGSTAWEMSKDYAETNGYDFKEVSK